MGSEMCIRDRYSDEEGNNLTAVQQTATAMPILLYKMHGLVLVVTTPNDLQVAATEN